MWVSITQQNIIMKIKNALFHVVSFISHAIDQLYDTPSDFTGRKKGLGQKHG